MQTEVGKQLEKSVKRIKKETPKKVEKHFKKYGMWEGIQAIKRLAKNYRLLEKFENQNVINQKDDTMSKLNFTKEELLSMLENGIKEIEPQIYDGWSTEQAGSWMKKYMEDVHYWEDVYDYIKENFDFEIIDQYTDRINYKILMNKLNGELFAIVPKHHFGSFTYKFIFTEKTFGIMICPSFSNKQVESIKRKYRRQNTYKD
jgi:hypothetical protein